MWVPHFVNDVPKVSLVSIFPSRLLSFDKLDRDLTIDYVSFKEINTVIFATMVRDIVNDASRVGGSYKSHLQLTGRLNHHAPLRLLRQNLPWIRPCLSTLRSNYCASLTIHITVTVNIWRTSLQVDLRYLNTLYCTGWPSYWNSHVKFCLSQTTQFEKTQDYYVWY